MQPYHTIRSSFQAPSVVRFFSFSLRLFSFFGWVPFGKTRGKMFDDLFFLTLLERIMIGRMECWLGCITDGKGERPVRSVLLPFPLNIFILFYVTRLCIFYPPSSPSHLLSPLLLLLFLHFYYYISLELIQTAASL